jgi:phosphate transport system substrate-binding protein
MSRIVCASRFKGNEMRPFCYAISLAVAAIATMTTWAAARDNIWVVGSSTVQPFTKAVAERVAKVAGTPAPIVENTGTTPGFWALCEGVGPDHPDATNATRRIKQSEFEVCQKNGVEIVELAVGLDILVVAQSRAGPPVKLTPAEMFLALGKDVPDKEGRLVANPYKKWSDIDGTLPDMMIEMRVLPPISGTRDAMQELFLQKGADSIPALAALFSGDGTLRATAKAIRTDGNFVIVQENQDAIARALVANPNAFGVFGYRFLQANRATLRGVPIDDAEPTEENAYSSKYKGTRKLYLYVKKAHFNFIPGLDKLAPEYVSGAALGPDGYLLALGFVPLGIDDMIKTIALIDAMTPLRGQTLKD